MPFVKGQSGNPGGRPKAERAIREMIQQKGPDLIQRLLQFAQSKDPYAALPAIRELLNRGYGRPVESVRLSADVEMNREPVVYYATAPPPKETKETNEPASPKLSPPGDQ